MRRLFIRQRGLPTELEVALDGLRAVVIEVEAAKEAMTSTVPSTRLPGTPLAEAIAELEDHLARAQDLMPTWRHPDVEDEWLASESGIGDSLERARQLREDPPELGGFEGLIWVVDQVLAPLEAFEAAAERFRSLRR
ncbi:MAG TPA: hypothetical protein VFZ75_05040 [Actinomycetota bacterium]|nr:hypothetical protein [Actinomycetota bacterium]